jgi:enamine deaminase RidA (YjgF/YER057c/UK114 family)
MSGATTVITYPSSPTLLDARRLGFSHVSVTARPTIVHVAGQVAIDSGGNPVGGGDLGEQAKFALENVRRALAAAGASAADVVALRVYIVGLRQDMFPVVARRVAEFVGDGEPPPATWMGVQSLLSSHALVEIEAVAALP